MKHLTKVALAVLAAAPMMIPAATYTYDFDTDQSSSFVVQEFGTPDSTIAWTYDYSTHVQDTPAINVPIPAAPNSSSTTLGVQMMVNESAAAANSLTIYPDVGGALTGDWTMTFDVWANHNGDAGGNTGSTEFIGFGAQADTTGPGVGEDGADGFSYIITGDGGSSNDARYSAGNPMATDNNIPAWFGGTPPNNNNLDADWTAFFPNDGTLGTAPTGTCSAGAIGKQWLTIRLAVTNSGADREVAFKKSGDASFTVVSTVTGGAGAFARPCIGYADFFATSVASEPTDQFVVFDNLVIDTGSDVADWALY